MLVASFLKTFLGNDVVNIATIYGTSKLPNIRKSKTIYTNTEKFSCGEEIPPNATIELCDENNQSLNLIQFSQFLTQKKSVKFFDLKKKIKV